MKDTMRISRIACLLLLISGLSSGLPDEISATRTPSHQGAKNIEGNNIVDTLLPDGVADQRLLSRFKRAEAVNALRKEQGKARGRRATGIAYLLAYLKYDYRMNRKRIVDALQGCIHRSSAIECDENTAGYVIDLFERGDTGLLKHLVDVGPFSDGALAEMMGPFYATVLAKNTSLVLQNLSRLSKKDQRRIGFLAATGDGSGLGSRNLIREIQSSLGHYVKETADPLSPVARTCLSGFNAGLKAVR